MQDNCLKSRFSVVNGLNMMEKNVAGANSCRMCEQKELRVFLFTTQYFHPKKKNKHGHIIFALNCTPIIVY